MSLSSSTYPIKNWQIILKILKRVQTKIEPNNGFALAGLSFLIGCPIIVSLATAKPQVVMCY